MENEDFFVHQVIRDMLMMCKNKEIPPEVFIVLQDIGLSLHSMIIPPSNPFFIRAVVITDWGQQNKWCCGNDNFHLNVAQILKQLMV